MTRTFLRTALLALLLTLLAACASQGGRLVSAGDTRRVFDVQLDTSLDWARVRGPRQEVWTIDGLPLNRLHFYSRVRPGEHVFLGARERKRRPDGPWFRTGMRPDEVRDIILDALREGQWARVEGTDLRPARFGDTDGLRFELSMASPTGLRYRGTAAAAERKGRLTVVVWAAASEHYYDRDAKAVARMIDTMRFVE